MNILQPKKLQTC